MEDLLSDFFVNDCILLSGILTCATIWERNDCSNENVFSSKVYIAPLSGIMIF